MPRTWGEPCIRPLGLGRGGGEREFDIGKAQGRGERGISGGMEGKVRSGRSWKGGGFCVLADVEACGWEDW
jgi:hypothetical protein